MASILIIFDGPPGPDAPRFIEVEDEDGNSVSVGEWVELKDRGYWALKLPVPSSGATATLDM